MDHLFISLIDCYWDGNNPQWSIVELIGSFHHSRFLLWSTSKIGWWIFVELEIVISTVCKSSIPRHILPLWGYQIHIKFNWGFIKGMLLFLRLSNPLSFWLSSWDLFWSSLLETLIDSSFWFLNGLLLSWRHFFVQCVDFVYQGVFPHF